MGPTFLTLKPCAFKSLSCSGFSKCYSTEIAVRLYQDVFLIHPCIITPPASLGMLCIVLEGQPQLLPEEHLLLCHRICSAISHPLPNSLETTAMVPCSRQMHPAKSFGQKLGKEDACLTNSANPSCMDGQFQLSQDTSGATTVLVSQDTFVFTLLTLFQVFPLTTFLFQPPPHLISALQTYSCPLTRTLRGVGKFCCRIKSKEPVSAVVDQVIFKEEYL